MLKLTELAEHDAAHDDILTLPFELRQKSRFSGVTDGGVEVGLFLPRGQVLRSGQVITGDDHFTVLISAALEQVSVVRIADSLKFAKACYHLGNRHVSLEILPGELHYLADHVLDHMVEGLGLTIRHESMPFEPEAGAYHGHDH